MRTVLQSLQIRFGCRRLVRKSRKKNSPEVVASWSTLALHFRVKWLGASPNILLEIPNKKLVTTTLPDTATTITRETTTTTTTAIAAPANTAAAAIYETTTTPEQLDPVENARHVITTSAPIPTQFKLEATTTATATDSNDAISMDEQQDKEESGVGREEEAKGREKQDEVSKQEAEQRELTPIDPVRTMSANAAPCDPTNPTNACPSTVNGRVNEPQPAPSHTAYPTHARASPSDTPIPADERAIALCT